MGDVKLFVSDVDGTLLTRDKVLTPRACAAVRKLHEAGIAFAITSGRPPRGMAMLVGPLAITTPLAAFNGGMLVEPDLTTVLVQRTLPRPAATEAVTYLLAAGLDVFLYTPKGWFIRKLDGPHVDRERHNVQFEPTVVRDFDSLLDDTVKIVGVSDDHPRVERCEVELRRRLEGRVSAARSQLHYLDVTHPDANKGMVVRELSRRLDVPFQNIATMGDMPNDVLMFGLASVSIAMGNASWEVQRCARYVTESNEDDGFAKAVERFVLGPKQITSAASPPAP
jgi:Cof subfamily protein (haloacid dehalogenase superfamily)